MLCLSKNSSDTTHGASGMTSSTHLDMLKNIWDTVLHLLIMMIEHEKDDYLQWRSDSYRSSSVITVLPLYLCVNSSLQHPTRRYVFANLQIWKHSLSLLVLQ
jgi:hypothetical protein